MSTHAFIAHATPSGHIAGRYHHFDGFPSGLGRGLWDLYHGNLGGSLTGDWLRLKAVLLNEHPAGWNTIVGNWDIDPKSGIPQGPQCYCHGQRTGNAQLLTEYTAQNFGCEYGYVLTETSFGNPFMRIVALAPDGESNSNRMMKSTSMSTRWAVVAEVVMDGKEPNWSMLDDDALALRRCVAGDKK